MTLAARIRTSIALRRTWRRILRDHHTPAPGALPGDVPWTQVVDLLDDADRSDAAILAALRLADAEETGATRWEHPLPVPEWAGAVRTAIAAALGVDSDAVPAEPAATPPADIAAAVAAALEVVGTWLGADRDIDFWVEIDFRRLFAPELAGAPDVAATTPAGADTSAVDGLHWRYGIADSDAPGGVIAVLAGRPSSARAVRRAYVPLGEWEPVPPAAAQ